MISILLTEYESATDKFVWYCRSLLTVCRSYLLKGITRSDLYECLLLINALYFPFKDEMERKRCDQPTKSDLFVLESLFVKI